MPDSGTRLFEVNEVVEQIVLVLQVLLCDESTIADLFYWHGLKPAWSSASSSSALALSLLKITQNMILLRWLIGLMVKV